MAVVTAYVDQVQKAYIAYYGRPADTTGLDYWTNQLSTVGGSWTSLINAFGNSAEATTLLSGLTTEQKVNKLYQQMFGRDADVSGLTYYSVGIANGTFTLASVAINILNGATGTDSTNIANKLTSAKLFTTGLDTATKITNYNSSSVADVRTWLATVTTTAATQASVDSAVSTMTNNGSINGTTYTLTTGVDTLTGTANNDLFNSTINSATNAYDAATSSLQVPDTLDGAGGTDTLSVTVTGATTNADIALPVANLKNIEVLKVRTTIDTGTASKFITVDASAIPGLTTVYADRSTSKGDLKVANLAANSVVGIIGDGTTVNGALHATYVNAATAATLNVSGGTTSGAVTLVGAGVTTLNVNSTGAANTLAGIAAPATTKTVNIVATTNLTTGGITGVAASSTINVSGGATSVDLGTIAANATTVNASGMTTGGITATLATATSSVKGGAGTDIITNAALTTTTAGAIDAGAGTADKLIVASAIDTAAKGALYTNFEVLQNNVGAQQDVSLVAGITSIVLGGNTAGTKGLTAAQAIAITNVVDNTGSTQALATATGTSDVLTVTLNNATSTASADLKTVTVDGFETMNVVSSSGTTGDTSLLSFTSAAQLTALNLSGAAPLSVDTANIVKAAAINAASLTGPLTITGALIKGSSVVATAAADAITITAQAAGAAGDYITYDAGAGNDAISATVAGINNTNNAKASVKIDGGAGTDTLTFTENGLTLTDANFQYVTNIEKIAYAVNDQAVDIQTGGYFNTNFKTNGVTFTIANQSAATSLLAASFEGATTVSLTSSATTQDLTIKTGSGADTITIGATSVTTGDITVETGAGNDTVSITVSGALANGNLNPINLGNGQDSLTLSGLVVADAVSTSVITNAGSSTLTAFDSITGYVLSDGTDKGVVLKFDGAGAAAANATAVAITGYTSAELTYTVNGGLLTFAGTSAAALNDTQKATLAQTVITTEKATVLFNGATDSYVFNNLAAGDSLIKLVGVTSATAVGLGVDSATNKYVNIG